MVLSDGSEAQLQPRNLNVCPAIPETPPSEDLWNCEASGVPNEIKT